MSAAQSTLVIDDHDVRVTTWTFAAAGETTGRHLHEFDYIVVPVTGGRFTVTDAHGRSREMTQQPGTPYRGNAGTEHEVATISAPAVFVEIELKRQLLHGKKPPS